MSDTGEVTRDDDIEFCADCGHAADTHDRRAEDGSCSECARTDGPCASKRIREEPTAGASQDRSTRPWTW